MHELAIMQSAIDRILERARDAGASRVCAVTLRVGDLSGAVPEALEMSFAAVTAGTPAENAELIIERVPAVFWCEPCQREFGSESLLAECPGCGAISRSLRSGRELEIASMEIE
jgi:hydrogenase nickel incorporation protein HypA/HybF